MKRRSIPFRDLLKQVLPIDRLPADTRERVARALEHGDPRAIESISLEAMSLLEAEGHLRFMEEVLQGEDKFRRYRDLTTGNILAVRVPVTEEDEGVLRIALPIQKWRGRTSLDQIRTLFGLYNKILTQNSELLSSPREILREVRATGRRVLGCDEVTFWAAPREETTADLLEASSDPYDEELVTEWVLEKRHMLCYPDLPAQIDPETGHLDRRYQSLAIIPLGDDKQAVYGTLLAWSAQPHFFDESRLGLLSLLSEVASDLCRRSEILGKLVFVDGPTGVYNRAFYELQLDNEIARAHRDKQTFALAIADIDDFKQFNERYGYEGGNQVLATAAEVFRSGLRPFDTVARWGGEEFAVILTAPVTPDHAMVVCERLRKAAALSRFTLTGLAGESLSAQLTVSIGGALYPEDGGTAKDLWRAANAALVHAKQTGKNKVVFASDLPPEQASSGKRSAAAKSRKKKA